MDGFKNWGPWGGNTKSKGAWWLTLDRVRLVGLRSVWIIYVKVKLRAKD
jgi:hypothetical protein